MSIPFNKWRHDLRAAINTIENTIRVLDSQESDDPELIRVTIESLRKTQANLEQQYLDVYTLQRQQKELNAAD